MKKLFSLVLCVALIAMCMGATAFAAEKDNYVIGALMKQNADTFVKNISDAIVAHANELGNVTLDMQDAEGDINKQLEQAETMLTKGVDAVILNAVDVEGSAPIVDLCLEAGVPVIECNTLTNNSDAATCYVGSDDVDAGRIQAEFLKTVLPEDAKVCYMMGPIGVSPQIYRLEGITTYLFDERPEMQVLQSQTANWKRDEAMALAETWLTQYQDLDAIICQNDDMAMGALEAAEGMGRKEGLVIVGIDAITDAVQAVSEGRLEATVFQDAAGQGAGALDVAIDCVKNDLMKTEDVWIPFIPVTPENVADYM
ncbi:MAG: substrate-binding domain-containing protein [Clostridia bacterium]|nr:substrate-binding domain-containing protein [Clostridia bacterium]